MNTEKIVLSSKTVDLSEHKTYLLLVDRVCYYDYPNLNGTMLPSEGALEAAKTLVGMPVYAKYRVNAEGLPTFGGHEAYIDEDGELAFGTEMIGTHIDVEIKEDVVNVGNEWKTLPCLFATLKIPTRKKNVVAAIKRLYAEGKLHNSWEVVASEYSFSNNIKTLTKYEFEGNTFLGYEYAEPAYGESAKVISLSSKESELMIAEALSKDLLSDMENSTEQEVESLDKEQEATISEVVSEESQTVETPVEDTEISTTDNADAQADVQSDAPQDAPEQASLTDLDLRKAIHKACVEKLNRWCWIAFHFPLEKKVWCEAEDRESELDYLQFTYEIENDVVTVSEPVDVKLTVSISEVNQVIAEKNDALVQANQTICELQKKIEELSEFKEAYEKIQAEKAKAEREAQVEELCEYVKASKCFTQEELESEPISTLIAELKIAELKQLIADRFVLSQKQLKDKNKVKTEKNEMPIQSSLVTETNQVDYSVIMKDFLSR